MVAKWQQIRLDSYIVSVLEAAVRLAVYKRICFRIRNVFKIINKKVSILSKILF